MVATTRSVTYSTQIAHISSGAAIAAGAVSASTDVAAALSSTNLARYDSADLAIFVSNTASIASASSNILVLRRDINFDGTNDEPLIATATSSKFLGHQVGVITVPPFSVASTSYHNLTNVEVTDQCEFYLSNATNTGIGAGWTIKVTPRSDAFA